MTEEQERLVMDILQRLCTDAILIYDPVTNTHSCRYCGRTEEFAYGRSYGVEHTDSCVVTLNRTLQQTRRPEEGW